MRLISSIKLWMQITYYDTVVHTSTYFYTLFKALTGKATTKKNNAGVLQVPLSSAQMDMLQKYYPTPVWFEGMTETEMAYRTGADAVVQRILRMHKGDLYA